MVQKFKWSGFTVVFLWPNILITLQIKDLTLFLSLKLLFVALNKKHQEKHMLMKPQNPTLPTKFVVIP